MNGAGRSFSAWEERPGALYGIAMCERALGHASESQEALDQLKQAYPDSYFVKMAGGTTGGAR